MSNLIFKQSLESYDIKSLSEVHEKVNIIKNKCVLLEGYGYELKKMVEISSEEFNTINYVRIENATDDFIKKLRLSIEDLDILVKSCEAFIEKILEIWR
jgi:molybdopterin-guanine dinucleotide biosynthesis protein